MFVSPAYAQAAGGGADGGIMAFLPLILIFVVFYFLLIRPQQKRAKQHKEMLANLRRGDRVVTAGGIIGMVTKAADDELTVEIAENVRVKVARAMVAEVLAKTEPVKGGKDDDEAAAAEPAPETKAGGLKGLLSGKDKK
ncbi:preprotein translocase subunit YajC [Novispirillum sp. DQ9]|uniref:preprotein translocase subunit YajC n=1 Tax=Novispirillum sp. DQ9 TaxID=3398612 RepID=UPI003C79EF29